jgi:sorbitol-specific phosphotransferase system component IIC
MAWFRTNRGVAAWLALFALACQLAFSFGHVHIDKYSSGFAHLADQTTHVATGGSPSSPENNPGKLSFDFCAICANISIASTLILPVLAAILAPRLFTRVLRWLPATRLPAVLYHRPFGARGPPSA